MTETRCRVCGGRHCRDFLFLRDMPNTMRLLDRPDAPDPLFDLDLRLCPDCGFVFMANDVPVSDFYDTTQMPTSAFPPAHLVWLRETMVALAEARSDAMIYEIGCNDGDFLQHFVDAGFLRLHGIEPADACFRRARDRGCAVTHGYFTEAAAQAFVAANGQPRIVVSRHVFEHIPDLDDLLAGLDRLCGERTLLTVEVPDFGAIVDQCQFCNIWEQHCNYFDAHALTALLARIGLRPVRLDTVPFGGGSLVLHFRRDAPAMASAGGANIPAKLDFLHRMEAYTREARALVREITGSGRRLAVFGAGGRGACFVNIADIAGAVDFAIDEHPAKIGRYMTKSKLEIRGAAFLDTAHIDACILLPMNKKEMEYSIFERHAAFVRQGGLFIELWPESGGLYKRHEKAAAMPPRGVHP